MKNLDDINDLLYVLGLSGGKVPVNLRNIGHYIKNFDGRGPLGGVMTQVFTDQQGRLQSTSMTVSSVLGCGHLVTSADGIAGFCQICGRVTCHQCLAVCEMTGITSCRRHYTIYKGVVVSDRARKGLWKLRAKRIAQHKSPRQQQVAGPKVYYPVKKGN